MPRFKVYNYDQTAMVVTNYQDQLQSGTFEHSVHYLIEHEFELSVFHLGYCNYTIGKPLRHQSLVQKDLQPSYVSCGSGIRQHWHDEKAEPVQSTG
ncbi:hypothetical protein [Vreelandella stevensii]|uniref:hypothetical protein n=1 Tax=Vreelandella stevensii TaxID=502821 RepID=UPI0037487237